MKKIMLNMLIACSLHIYAAAVLDSAFQDPWKCVEYHLLDKPKKNYQSLWTTVTIGGSTLAAFLGSAYASQKLYDKTFCWQEHDADAHALFNLRDWIAQYDPRQPRLINYSMVRATAIGGATGLWTALFYQTLSSQIKKHFERKAFVSFVRTWSYHKEYTPKQLHAIFDECHAQVAQQELSTETVDETYQVVSQVIKDHFPHVYPKQPEDQSFWTSKTFAARFDMGTTLSGLAQIFKAFYPHGLHQREHRQAR